MQKGHCIHCVHEGLDVTCKLGRDPAAMARQACTDPDWRMGAAYRYPCSTRENHEELFMRNGATIPKRVQDVLNQKTSCDAFTEPTQEQIDEQEKLFDKFLEDMAKTEPLITRIKKEHKGKAWNGIEVCPACNGKLHMTHSSYNGHVHGRCETEGCLRWME